MSTGQVKEDNKEEDKNRVDQRKEEEVRDLDDLLAEAELKASVAESSQPKAKEEKHNGASNKK